MSNDASSSVFGIILTDNAARRILELAAQEKKTGAMLRITVEGGGCSGFKYHYEFPVWETTAEDTLIHNGDAAAVIDSVSLDFMKNVRIDYVETLGSAGFEITNPNATAACGCGNSFSV